MDTRFSESHALKQRKHWDELARQKSSGSSSAEDKVVKSVSPDLYDRFEKTFALMPHLSALKRPEDKTYGEFCSAQLFRLIESPLTHNEISQFLESFHCMSPGQRLLVQKIQTYLECRNVNFWVPWARSFVLNQRDTDRRLQIEYLLSCLHWAREKELDEGVLYGMNEWERPVGVSLVLTVLDHEKSNDTLLGNLLENYLQNPKREVIAVNPSPAATNKKKLVKTKRQAIQDEANQLYQAHWEHFNAHLYDKKTSSLDNLYFACRSLLVAKMLGNKDAALHLRTNTDQLLSHQLDDALNREYEARLREIPVDNLYYTLAQAHLFGLIYGRKTGTVYVEAKKRYDEIDEALSALHTNCSAKGKHVLPVIGEAAEQLLSGFPDELTEDNLRKSITSAFVYELVPSGGQPLLLRVQPKEKQEAELLPLLKNASLANAVCEEIAKHARATSILCHEFHGRYELSISTEQLDSKQCFYFVDKNGVEIARVQQIKGNVKFQAYGDNIQFSVKGPLKAHEVIIENEQGKTALRAQIESDSTLLLAANTTHFDYFGSAEALKKLVVETTGECELKPQSKLHASAEVVLKANELALDGQVATQGTCSVIAKQAFVVGPEGVCNADDGIVISAGAMKDVRGQLSSKAEIDIEVADSIYLHGRASISAETRLKVKAKSFMSTDKAKVHSGEQADIDIAEKLILDKETNWQSKNITIIADKFKLYTPHFKAAKARVRGNDYTVLHKGAAIEVDETIEFRGGSLWNAGEIRSEKSLQVKVNQVFMHGLSSMSLTDAKESACQALLKSDNINIIAGAVCNFTGKIEAARVMTSSIAYVNLGLTEASNISRTNIFSLDLGIDIPNKEQIMKSFQRFWDLFRKRDLKALGEMLFSWDTVMNVSTFGRFFLRTIDPVSGKGADMVASLIMLLYNFDSFAEQCKSLATQDEPVEACDIYALIARMGNIASQAATFESLCESFDATVHQVHQDAQTDSNAAADSKSGYVSELPSLALNLVSLFLPGISDQSVVGMRVGGFHAAPNFMDRSGFSLDLACTQIAVNKTDSFYSAARVLDVTVVDNQARFGHDLVEADATLAMNVFTNVHELTTSSTVVANRVDIEAENIREKGEMKANQAHITARNHLSHNGLVNAVTAVLHAQSLSSGADSETRGNTVVISADQSADLSGNVDGSTVVVQSGDRATMTEDFHTTGRVVDVRATGHMDFNGSVDIISDASATDGKVALRVEADSLNQGGGHLDAGHENVAVISHHDATLQGATHGHVVDVSGGGNVTTAASASFHGSRVQITAKQHLEDNSSIDVDHDPTLKTTDEKGNIIPTVSLEGQTVHQGIRSSIEAGDDVVNVISDGDAKLEGAQHAKTLYAHSKSGDLTMSASYNVEAKEIHASAKNKLEYAGTATIDEIPGRKLTDNDGKLIASFSMTADEVVEHKEAAITATDSVVALTGAKQVTVAGEHHVNKWIANATNGNTTVAASANTESKEASYSATEKVEYQGHDTILADADRKTVNEKNEVIAALSIHGKEVHMANGSQIDADKEVVSVSATGHASLEGKANTGILFASSEESDVLVSASAHLEGNTVNISAKESLSIAGEVKGTNKENPVSRSTEKSSVSLTGNKVTQDETGVVDAKEGSVSVTSHGGEVIAGKTYANVLINHANEGDVKITSTAYTEAGTAEFQSQGTIENHGTLVAGDPNAEQENKAEPENKADVSAEQKPESDGQGTADADKDAANADQSAENKQSENHVVPSVRFEANKVDMAADSRTDVSDQDHRMVYLRAHDGHLAGHVKASNLNVDFDNLSSADVQNLAAQQGQYSDVSSASLSITTQQAVNFDHQMKLTHDVEVTASSITVEQKLDSTENLTLQSSVGDVDTKADVHSDKKLEVRAARSVNNLGKNLTAHEAVVHANQGDVNNQGGTIQGTERLEVIAFNGAVKNTITTKDVAQGNDYVATLPVKGQLLGGTGEEHKGEGLYIQSKGKVVNSGSTIHVDGSGVILAEGGLDNVTQSYNSQQPIRNFIGGVVPNFLTGHLYTKTVEEKESSEIKAEGNLQIQTSGDLNNDHSNIKGVDVKLHALEGNIRNTAGLVQGSNFVSAVADKGNVELHTDERNVQGAYDTMKAYTPAEIIGGAGEGHNGTGTYIKAGNRVVVDGSVVAAEGNNYIKGEQGVDFQARSHRYVSYYKEHDTWYGSSSVDRDISVQVQASAMLSSKGKNIVISDQGRITTCAAQFKGLTGTEFSDAKGEVVTGIKTSTEHYSDKSHLWGLIDHERNEVTGVNVPTTIESLGDVKIVSLGKVQILDAAIDTPGKVIIQGSDIVISAPTLDNRVDEETRTIGIVGPASQGINGVPVYQDVRALGSSHTAGEKAANTWNFGIDTANLANSLLSAYRANSMGQALFQMSPITVCAINGTRTSTTTKWQTVADNTGIHAGQLELKADNDISLTNGVAIISDGDAEITAKTLHQSGAELKQSVDSDSESVSIGVSAVGDVNFGASASVSSASGVTHANQVLAVHGKLTEHVDKVYMHNANTTAGSLAGEVKELEVVSEADTSQSESYSAQVSSNGNFNVDHATSSSATVGTVSGYEVGDADFSVQKTNLVGGRMVVHGENHMSLGAVTSTDVPEYSESDDKGFGANAFDLASQVGGRQWDQPLPTANVSHATTNWQAAQHGTAYANNGAIKTDSVSGNLNTSNASGEVVTKDESSNIEVKVPLYNPQGLKQIEDNIEWAEQKLNPQHPTVPQYMKADQGSDGKPTELSKDVVEENGDVDPQDDGQQALAQSADDSDADAYDDAEEKQVDKSAASAATSEEKQSAKPTKGEMSAEDAAFIAAAEENMKKIGNIADEDVGLDPSQLSMFYKHQDKASMGQSKWVANATKAGSTFWGGAKGTVVDLYELATSPQKRMEAFCLIGAAVVEGTKHPVEAFKGRMRAINDTIDDIENYDLSSIGALAPGLLAGGAGEVFTCVRGVSRLGMWGRIPKVVESLDESEWQNAFKHFEGLQTGEASDTYAQPALHNKLSAVQDAQNDAVKTEYLPDGSVRYYEKERPARTPGYTRGSSYVTEFNPDTGSVKSWVESYNHKGEVTRVHPKMINGQTIDSPHIPPIASEKLSNLTSPQRRFRK